MRTVSGFLCLLLCLVFLSIIIIVYVLNCVPFSFSVCVWQFECDLIAMQNNIFECIGYFSTSMFLLCSHLCQVALDLWKREMCIDSTPNRSVRIESFVYQCVFRQKEQQSVRQWQQHSGDIVIIVYLISIIHKNSSNNNNNKNAWNSLMKRSPILAFLAIWMSKNKNVPQIRCKIHYMCVSNVECQMCETLLAFEFNCELGNWN